MWRRVILVMATTTAMIGAFAAPAAAGNVDHDHFVIEEQFPEQVITDLPCLLGKEFLATGSAIFRGTVVDAGADGFHFSQIEKFESTLVPVDGIGPTYVEGGNATHISFNARATSGVATFTRVNNDRYFAFEGGKVVSAATIRVHELIRFVVTDTDGDGAPDIVKSNSRRPNLAVLNK